MIFISPHAIETSREIENLKKKKMCPKTQTISFFIVTSFFFLFIFLRISVIFFFFNQFLALLCRARSYCFKLFLLSFLRSLIIGFVTCKLFVLAYIEHGQLHRNDNIVCRERAIEIEKRKKIGTGYWNAWVEVFDDWLRNWLQ